MRWIVVVFGLIASSIQAFDIPTSIRFTLEREENTYPIVYYFSPPETALEYPILVLCDSGSAKEVLHSAFLTREFFAEKIQALQVGYLVVEKRGIDGNSIDEKEFWSHYTRSERLKDHLSIIDYLEKNPPLGWNKQLIFVGLAEGGILATDLATTYPNTLATINWVGAFGMSWADDLWQTHIHLKQDTCWVRFCDVLPKWLPCAPDFPPNREEFDLLVAHIVDNPSTNQWLGGMTYLYHRDAFLRPPVDYTKIRSPFLVVRGTADWNLESSDLFVQTAQEAGAPITYFRIEGMDHWIRKRPDIIDQSFDWLKQHLTPPPKPPAKKPAKRIKPKAQSTAVVLH